MTILFTALFFLASLTAVEPVQGTDGQRADAQAVFEEGIAAFRRGAFDEADLLWRSLLDTELGDDARARLYYDLGNAAWRRGAPHEAIGWYASTLRVDPRHGDAWHNLEFVRAAVGIEPADRGDLRSTANRIAGSLRPGEARWVALLGLVPLVLAFLGEAFIGGLWWRRAAWLGLFLALVGAAPWVWHLTRSELDPLLVVGTPKVTVRSEPRQSLGPIGELQPGDEVERLDSLSGWVRVETPDGLRGWVAEDAVFALPIE